VCACGIHQGQEENLWDESVEERPSGPVPLFLLVLLYGVPSFVSRLILFVRSTLKILFPNTPYQIARPSLDNGRDGLVKAQFTLSSPFSEYIGHIFHGTRVTLERQ
jgi:hypothetical protein